ncbi:MAG TPA: acyl-ACP thioesterase domain-containing protein [Solirubrobacteraceae bacterium]|nr:acyl-ACP thioesterase domain-containing protein [Solirubrobacteraceae bacterium]
MPTAKLTELVERPERGRVFTEPARPGLADCSPSGRVRLDSLARFTQDIAYADALDVGLSETTRWVVRRTRMRVDRFPRFGQPLALATFCSGLGRMWAERRTSIVANDEDNAGEGGRVEVVSLWVHLDPVSLRPTPLREDELEAWGESAGARKVTARLHHPSPDGALDRSAWRFRVSECDVAGHVNNAAYFLPLEEELLEDGDPASIDVEIEYRSPAQPGEKTVLRNGARRWIVAPDGETHASLIIAGTPTLNKEA